MAGPIHSFKPFTDDCSSLNIGELTFENHPDRIVTYGSQEFTPTAASLAQARALAGVYGQIAAKIEQKMNQTPAASTTAVHGKKPNPFKPG